VLLPCEWLWNPFVRHYCKASLGWGWSHFVNIVLVKWSVYKVITCRRVSSLHYEWVAPAVGSQWHDCDWTRHRESRSKQSLVFWPPAQCRPGPHTHSLYGTQTSKYTRACAQSCTNTETHAYSTFSLSHIYAHTWCHTFMHSSSQIQTLSVLTHSHMYGRHSNALSGRVVLIWLGKLQELKDTTMSL